MSTEPNPLLEAALRFAQHGWPVLPVVPGEKIPATKHGVKDATTDPDKIAWWWGRNEARNVGIATGAPGPDVLDVDIAHGRPGPASLNKLIRADLIGKPQALIRTPSGGTHLLWRGTEQGNGSLPEHGLDYRGRGGYIVAVPSVVGGRAYELVKAERSADTCDWAAIKGFLQPERQRPAGRSAAPGDVGRLAAWVGSLREGQNRNDRSFWAMCRAVEQGDMAALDSIAAAAISTGLTEREVHASVQSALRTASPKAQAADREAAS